MSSDASKPSFKLQTGDQNFDSRKNDVFASLQTIEDKHKAYETARRTRDERSEEGSDFKKPSDPPLNRRGDCDRPSRDRYYGQHDSFHGRGRHHGQTVDCRDRYRGRGAGRNWNRQERFTPDYRKHPEKWTRYDLGDVTASDMSDRSNAQAAFAFLEERRKLREAEIKTDSDPNEIDTKVVFRKIESRTKQNVDKCKTSRFIGGKLTMPEYVVGQTKPTHKKSRNKDKANMESSSSSSSCISLSHLDEEDIETVAEDGEKKIIFKDRKNKPKRSLRAKTDDD